MIETHIKKLNGKKYLKLQNLFNSYLITKLACQQSMNEEISPFSIYVELVLRWNKLFSYYAKLVNYDVEKMNWFDEEYR